VTTGWLVRDGVVLAAAEIPETRRGRARGLLRRDGIDGIMVLRPCRNVHTLGMRFPIDVVFCDRGGIVLRVSTLRPGRISAFVARSAMVLEAEAGACARWELRVGDTVEIRS